VRLYGVYDRTQTLLDSVVSALHVVSVVHPISERLASDEVVGALHW